MLEYEMTKLRCLQEALIKERDGDLLCGYVLKCLLTRIERLENLFRQARENARTTDFIGLYNDDTEQMIADAAKDTKELLC